MFAPVVSKIIAHAQLDIEASRNICFDNLWEAFIKRFWILRENIKSRCCLAE